MGIVANKSEFISRCYEPAIRIKPKVEAKMRTVAYVLHEQILRRTPVWSGALVRNYIWSAGVPSLLLLPPIDNGPTGATNTMSLGSEPRRPPNEEASWIILRSITFQMGNNYCLTNNDPAFGGVEAGLFPPPPLKQRSSAMVARAVAYVKSRFGV